MGHEWSAFFGRGTREGGRQGKNFLEEMTPVARGKVTAVVEEEGIGGSHELVPIMHIRTHREKIPPPVSYMPPGKCLNALLLRLLLSRTTPRSEIILRLRERERKRGGTKIRPNKKKVPKKIRGRNGLIGTREKVSRTGASNLQI